MSLYSFLRLLGEKNPKATFIKLVKTVWKQRLIYCILLRDCCVIFVILFSCLLLCSMPHFNVIPVREIKYVKLGTAEGLVMYPLLFGFLRDKVNKTLILF